jgi:cytoskeletal protein RodZ
MIIALDRLPRARSGGFGRVILLLIVLALVGAAAWWWWNQRQNGGQTETQSKPQTVPATKRPTSPRR